jgi:hypothetical protein
MLFPGFQISKVCLIAVILQHSFFPPNFVFINNLGQIWEAKPIHRYLHIYFVFHPRCQFFKVFTKFILNSFMSVSHYLWAHTQLKYHQNACSHMGTNKEWARNEGHKWLKIRPLERLVIDKYSILLGTFINYSFITWPRSILSIFFVIT